MVVESQGQAGLRSRRVSIDADTGDKVIDPAAQGVGGDKFWPRPVYTIDAGGHHKVVFLPRVRQRCSIFSAASSGGTVLLELAIYPHQVDFARAVNLRGWQHVSINVGDERGLAPTVPAIPGNEGEQAHCVVSGNWHNHRAIGLHEWLSPQTQRLVSRCAGLAPGVSTIPRGAHEDQAAFVIVIPLDITIAKIGA